MRLKRLMTGAMPLVLMLGACTPAAVNRTDSTGPGGSSDRASTTAPTETSPSSVPPIESTVTTADEGHQVTIAVSGWMGRDARGTVVCPFDELEACPGIPVTGGALPPVGDLVRVTGPYDGVSLQVGTVESWTPYERAELFNPCTGGSGPGSGGQSPEIQSRVEDALAGDENRLAGMWLADGQMVVALTGQDDELAERVREAHHRVCVRTGYPRSRKEIETLVADISRTLVVDEKVWILDSWDSVVDGPIRMRVEAIDTLTMRALAGEYGDALDLTAYIEVLDASLADLPVQEPPVPADVFIPTSGTRGGFAMMALATGVVLTLDDKAGCLFEDIGGGHRQLVVWPFGYSAVSGDPTIVYDAAGNAVARTGVPFDTGGGFADIGNVDPSQRCGADSMFQTAGPTQYEFETVWPRLDPEDE